MLETPLQKVGIRDNTIDTIYHYYKIGCVISNGLVEVYGQVKEIIKKMLKLMAYCTLGMSQRVSF